MEEAVVAQRDLENFWVYFRLHRDQEAQCGIVGEIVEVGKGRPLLGGKRRLWMAGKEFIASAAENGTALGEGQLRCAQLGVLGMNAPAVVEQIELGRHVSPPRGCAG